MQLCYSYLAIWNVMKYPVGSIPITLVEHGETDYEDDYNDIYTKAMRASIKGSEGIPIGVQMASTPYNEEKVLYLLKEIEEKVKFREKHCPPVF